LIVKPTFHHLRFSFCFSLWVAFVMVLLSLFNAHTAWAQSGVVLENVGATVTFGEQVLFVATVKASVPIQSMAISIFDESQGVRKTEPVSVQPDGRTEFRLDTRQTTFRPFSMIKWNYQFTLSDGTSFNSEVFSTVQR
jgi:hypothetical protein